MRVAVRAGRRAHRDLVHAGRPRGDRAHHHRGRIGGPPGRARTRPHARPAPRPPPPAGPRAGPPHRLAQLRLHHRSDVGDRRAQARRAPRARARRARRPPRPGRTRSSLRRQLGAGRSASSGAARAVAVRRTSSGSPHLLDVGRSGGTARRARPSRPDPLHQRVDLGGLELVGHRVGDQPRGAGHDLLHHLEVVLGAASCRWR